MTKDGFTYMLRLQETGRGNDGDVEVILKWRRINGNGEGRVFNSLASVRLVIE